MDISEKRALVIEHAKLTAALASGNESVRPRLEKIESQLMLEANKIAQLAVDEYLRDYN